MRARAAAVSVPEPLTLDELSMLLWATQGVRGEIDDTVLRTVPSAGNRHAFETYLAVERAVEIIGEAARRVSEEFRSAHPEIPWRSMIAQRNVLAHEYGEIKHERMWLLVTEHLPALIRDLEKLVPPIPPEPD